MVDYSSDATYEDAIQTVRESLKGMTTKDEMAEFIIKILECADAEMTAPEMINYITVAKSLVS